MKHIQNGVIKPWITLLIWHILLNLATSFFIPTSISTTFLSLLNLNSVNNPIPSNKKQLTNHTNASNKLSSQSTSTHSLLSLPTSSLSPLISDKISAESYEHQSQNEELAMDNSTQETSEYSEDVSTTDAEIKDFEGKERFSHSPTKTTHLLSDVDTTNSGTTSSSLLRKETHSDENNKRKKKTKRKKIVVVTEGDHSNTNTTTDNNRSKKADNLQTAPTTTTTTATATATTTTEQPIRSSSTPSAKKQLSF
jgi:hypothetical protein